MPRALVIEFSGGVSTPTLTNANGHGNTVRTTFLHYAPAGWFADVVECPLDFGVAALAYVQANAAAYALCICSYDSDIYYVRNLEQISRVHQKPLFMPMQSSATTRDSFYQKANVCFVGAGTSENEAGRGQRIDTFDLALNLPANQQALTSFSTAAVAGKAAALVDAGLNPTQVYKSIRQQALSYPTWSIQNGFGRAPGSYVVPPAYDLFPPQGTEMFRQSGNTLVVLFTRFENDAPESVRLYQNGQPVALLNIEGPSNFASNKLGSTKQFKVTHNVVSDGGSLTFDVSLVYGGVESQRFSWNSYTLSGFSDNNEPPPPPPPPPPVDPVPPGAPTGAFLATPSEVPYPSGSAVLSWTSVDASSASINGIGTVPVNGSQSVQITETTTYTLTLTGPGGQTVLQLTVTRAEPVFVGNVFDRHKFSTFDAVARTMGYDLYWGAHRVRVLLRRPTEPEMLANENLNPRMEVFEYKSGDLPGLYESVRAHNSETVLINGRSYKIRDVQAIFDGDTYLAQVVES